MASQVRNRRTLLKTLALLGLAGALLFVFAEQEAMANVSTIVVPRRQPIQIAVVVTLSDPFPDLGEGAVNAVQMAIEDHGPIQGFSVQRNDFDGECSPTAGEAAAKAVVRNPKNVGVIGHMCSGSYNAGLPIYEEAGVVTISGSATDLTSNLWPSGETVFNRTVIEGGDAGEWLNIVQTLPSVLAWQADYVTRFDSLPTSYPEYLPFYYDATRLLLTRIDEVASMHRGGKLVIDQAALASAVRDTENFLGVTCFITLDEFGSRISDLDQLTPCFD